MATYDYRCMEGHVVEMVRPMAERESPVTCTCGRQSQVVFTPNAAGIRIPPNFQSKNGCPTWSDFYDRTEKEMAKDPNIEKYAVAASRPGVGNTISQPGPELQRKVVQARDISPSAAI
jgi:putative FmdB family regulatory protein